MHIAIAFVLAAVVSLRPFAWGYSNAALTVELVAPPTPAESPLAAVTMPIPDIVSAPMTRTERAQLPMDPLPPPPVPATPAPSSVAPAPPHEATQASLTLGHIGMAEDYAAVSGLPEQLALRTQSEFLIEVDKLVRVVRNPDVVYPPEALKARREGTVVAWMAVNADGSLEEIAITSGALEFATAVQEALPTARFLPAENGGQTVPFYLIMTFEFRGS